MSPSPTPPAGHGQPDPADLAARLRLVTARLARVLRQQAGADLSPSLHSALASVDVHGPLTLGQLARREQVAPPTVTRIVERLEQDDLVVRTVDPSDRRQGWVSITDTGRRRMEESRNRRTAWLADRLGAFGPDDHRHLEAALPVLEALVQRPQARHQAQQEAPEQEGVAAADTAGRP